MSVLTRDKFLNFIVETIKKYLILSYLILSYLILSCLVLSCLVLSCLVLSYLILSYLILSYLKYLRKINYVHVALVKITLDEIMRFRKIDAGQKSRSTRLLQPVM